MDQHGDPEQAGTLLGGVGTQQKDQNKKGNYLGITIILPEQIELKKTDYVFLGFVQGREKVIEYLEERGMEYNKDIWILP